VGRSHQFLVHWEGYSDTEDSWVKEEDMDAEMVQVYFEKLEKETGENKIYHHAITKKYGREECKHGTQSETQSEIIGLEHLELHL